MSEFTQIFPTLDIGFTTVLYSEAEEKQIWNAAEEIVMKELVYIESVESSFGSFLLFIR